MPIFITVWQRTVLSHYKYIIVLIFYIYYTYLQNPSFPNKKPFKKVRKSYRIIELVQGSSAICIVTYSEGGNLGKTCFPVLEPAAK